MKTPMQEMLEWVRATLPMDLDTPRVIEQKIEAMLEKEKGVIIESHINGQSEFDIGARRIENDKYANNYYNETFNTKEI